MINHIQESKTCQNCKTDFTIEPEDFAFYEKMQVPPPTFCPQCRLIRRLAWRNERTLHKRICDKCKKNIISVFSKDARLNVYCPTCWWSDTWDATDYAQDVDFSKPFLAQLHELLQRVPIMGLFGFESTLINSPYCNMVDNLKNCYFLHNANFDEGVCYGSGVYGVKDSCDITLVRESELCYESVNCAKCYQIFYSQDCEDSNNIYFSKNLRGCSNCFGCVNLRNKSYYIFNEPHTKEEYERKIASLKPSSFQRQQETIAKAKEFWATHPHKYMHGTHNANVSGDYISNSKNASSCFNVIDVQDSKYCSIVALGGGLKDTYDFTHWGDNIELVYESMQIGDGVSGAKCSWCVFTNAQDVSYSILIRGCAHIFGCVGLEKKTYCILNKQYSKEEYEKLMPKIIEHMNARPYVDSKGRIYEFGEFFPIELSPFPYNESTAQEFFTLTKEEALTQGFAWKDTEKRNYTITKKSEELSGTDDTIPDSILNEVIGCVHKGNCNENCATAFKIIPAELEFYRKMNIPLPRLCPQCRHYQRLQQRNPMKLWHRSCQCAGVASENEVYKNATEHFHKTEHCPNEFETSYAPERKEIVYCEKCYNNEII